MKEIKKILKFMEGSKGIYLLAMLTIILSQVVVIVSPLIISATIDSIIGEMPIDNNFLARMMGFFGGREYLRNNLWLIGLSLIMLAILRGILTYLRNTLANEASEYTAKNIRDLLYDHIQKLPYEYHVKADTGDLIQRCTSDVNTIKRFLSIQLVEVAGSLFMLGFIAYTMLGINRKMTLVSMSTMPIIFGFALVFFSRVKLAFEASDKAEAELTTALQENLTGVRVVKACANQKYEIEKFDKRNVDYRDKTYKLIHNLALYWGASDFICFMQIGLTIVSGSIWAVRGEISLGTVLLFSTYVNMLLWPLRQMGRTLTDMGKAMVAIGRIEEILKEDIEVLKENNMEPEIRGNIDFKNISFEYEKGLPVLDDISFNIRAGTTLAIIGPTGSGKSSLVYLLARLYDYKKGSILVDGKELKSIDRTWVRKNIGIVLQEPFLYGKTIRDNIRLANPKLGDKEIYASAEIASIHEDIISFEKGYDTYVGERGVSLSGGQKQRIAIARTIINDCPIVVFDDSLSAVDTETDIAIRQALNNRKNKSTTIIISHRISTVAEADKIMVLDKGRIIQRGSHQELVKEDGLYKRLYEIQNSMKDLEEDIKLYA